MAKNVAKETKAKDTVAKDTNVDLAEKTLMPLRLRTGQIPQCQRTSVRQTRLRQKLSKGLS
ncbi:MAG: hypothetical protein AAFV85_28310, partial [Cyanobacteria bacterium J06634_6]